MDPLGCITTSRWVKWGVGRVSGLTLTLGEPKGFFKLLFQKQGPFVWTLFFFNKQRLETHEVQNAVLVFSPTDDLNYPSPLRGQR